MITRLCDALLDWIDGKLSVILVGLLVLIFGNIAFAIFVVITESRSSGVQLRKTEWQCTDTRTVPTTIYINTGGGTMVPTTTYDNVCIEYRKR